MENSFFGKKSTIRPDIDCYRLVLKTMARSRFPNAGDDIPKIFKSMDDIGVFPDTDCFDAAIETLRNGAKLSKPENADKYAKAAENMLIKMEREKDRSSAANIEPTAETYTNVIEALSIRKTKKASEIADSLLKKMDDASVSNKLMSPSKGSYLGVIKTFSNAASKTSFVRANGILQRMIAQYAAGNDAAKPDKCTYHAVIKACIASTGALQSDDKRKEALKLAISTVQDMKGDPATRPNSYSYLQLLRCAVRLLPAGDEREKALLSIFRNCVRDGCVDQEVIREYHSAVSDDCFRKTVIRPASTYNGTKSLPESWTKNLGYSILVQGEDGKASRKRNPVISIYGEVIPSTVYSDHKMRRLWAKTNQKLLRGGRVV